MSRPRRSGRFLAGPAGELALILLEPPVGVEARFAVLYLPPAQEEMNKSRRMTALQARAFAAAGGVVALLDPRGTGDSAGDHGDATWDGWREDAQSAWDWLGARARLPSVMWGLRMGALLATQVAASQAISPALLVLWQPVLSGRAYFNQWLRIATAQQITGRAGVRDARALRSALQTGSTVELTGYDLDPALVSGSEEVDLARLDAPRCPVLWRETSVAAPAALSPAAQKVVARWRSGGAHIDAQVVNGPSFWAAQEIAEAPELVSATTPAVMRALEREFAR